MSKLETSEEEKNNGVKEFQRSKKLAVKVQENFLPKRNLKKIIPFMELILLQEKYLVIFLVFILTMIVFILS